MFIVGIGGILLVGCFFLIGCSSPEERFAEKIEQANVNLENSEVRKAISILEQLEQDYPNQPQVLENLAFAFIKAEEYFEGAFYFNQLAQRFPENAHYYLYAAQAWLNAGDLESAIKDYETYLLENRDDWNTWQKIGDLYLETNQTSKAIHAYSNSSEIKFNPELDLKAALLANKSGNLRQAEEGYERLLVAEEDNIAKQAYIGLIQIKHKRRQWEEVERLMKTVEKRFPEALDSPEITQTSADYKKFKSANEEEESKIREEEERRKRLVDQQRQRAEELLASRRAALQPTPTPPTQEEAFVQDDLVIPPSQLAIDEVVTLEEPEVASPPPVEEQSPPVTVSPASSSGFQAALNKARKTASLNSQTAVARYWDAINMGDETGIAFYELSRLYYNRSEFSEAEMTSLEALRRDPSNNRYLMTYLTVIKKTKAKPDVVAEIRKYRNLYPKNADLILLLARTYAEPGGDPVAARSLYDLFFQTAPNHPETDRARYEVRGL